MGPLNNKHPEVSRGIAMEMMRGRFGQMAHIAIEYCEPLKGVTGCTGLTLHPQNCHLGAPIYRVGFLVPAGQTHVFSVEGEGNSWGEAIANLTRPDPLARVLEPTSKRVVTGSQIARIPLLSIRFRRPTDKGR